MESITNLRRAMSRHVGRDVGLDPKLPSLMVEHARAQGSAAEILALPVDTRLLIPLQDTNPASLTFGLPYFLPDFDMPDDPRRPVY